jgi:hypothetical protein
MCSFTVRMSAMICEQILEMGPARCMCECVRLACADVCVARPTWCRETAFKCPQTDQVGSTLSPGRTPTTATHLARVVVVGEAVDDGRGAAGRGSGGTGRQEAVSEGVSSVTHDVDRLQGRLHAPGVQLGAQARST